MAPIENYQQQKDAKRIVDLRSDTLSLPTAEMRQAMFDAELGDDVYVEDPTVIALERKCAELTGKEAGLFVPSGTMGNLIALMVHCSRRGSEVVVGHLSHVYLFEQGGASQLAGVQLSPIENKPDGTFCLTEFQECFRGSDLHEVITTMAVVENTHNMCGGKVIPLKWLDEFTRICRANNITPHMDGARVFNAAAQLGVPVARVVRDFASVSICLSKSLCAPVGSVLVGSKTFVAQARRTRKVLGGAMRQVGVLAAAGIVALDTIVPKLSEDHRRMKRIAQAISALQSPLVQLDVATVETNICIMRMGDAERFPADWLHQRLLQVDEQEVADEIVDKDGHPIIVKTSTRNKHFLRIVMYHGISDEQADLAIKKLSYCIKNMHLWINDQVHPERNTNTCDSVYSLYK